MRPTTSRTGTGVGHVRARLIALGATGLAVALVAAGCGTGSTPTPQAPVVTPAGTTTTTSPADTPSSSPAATDPATPSDPATTEPTATTGSTPSPTGDGATEGTPTPSDDATDDGSSKDGSGDDGTPGKSEGSDGKGQGKGHSTEHAELRSGDHGAKVETLQRRLLELGYWLPSADGNFGPSTQQAVWALQKAAGLNRDGVVGKKTQKALDRGVRPAAQTHHGHVIEVDLGKQLVLIVDDGHVGTILNASSGSGRPFKDKDGHQYVAHTPTGTYRMGRQYDGMYTSNLGLGTMWRPKFFNGGIALHGLGFDVPPYPASHGCVRISNPAMDWVWSTNKAPQGTVVTVYA
ncbi:peptidoglycan-binding protein [Luteimicrobium sp. NPDC057192]|uniref:L,D-transpeptidase family protein n=1 Tax=Luteimicrobium sp. NPDC057192 TaxID=3346042 RepID=UPI003640D4F8